MRVSCRGQDLLICSKILKNDHDVVLASVSNGANWWFLYADHRLRADEKFVIQCIQKNPEVLRYTSRRLKNKANVCFEAIEADPKQRRNVGNGITSRYGSCEEFLASYTGYYIKG